MLSSTSHHVFCVCSLLSTSRCYHHTLSSTPAAKKQRVDVTLSLDDCDEDPWCASGTSVGAVQDEVSAEELDPRNTEESEKDDADPWQTSRPAASSSEAVVSAQHRRHIQLASRARLLAAGREDPLRQLNSYGKKGLLFAGGGVRRVPADAKQKAVAS